MEADKRVYYGSTYADFINWVYEKLMRANESEYCGSITAAYFHKSRLWDADAPGIRRLGKEGENVQIQRPVNLRNLWPQSP